MAPLPVADALKCEVKGHVAGGQAWANVLHYDLPGTFDQAYADAKGDILHDHYEELAAYLPPETTLEEIVWTDLSSPTGPQYVHTPASVTIGTSASDPLPPQVATLINWRTALRGRAYRGKTYLPPAAENACTAEGGPSGAWLALCQAWADDVVDISDADLCIVSYFTGHTWAQDENDDWHKIPTPRAEGIVTPVVSGSPSTSWATIRGRNR